jgi:heme/copper-type cytochrome/quinol oxidase subunit 2
MMELRPAASSGRRSGRWRRLAAVALVVAGPTALGWAWGGGSTVPRERTIDIVARSYAFDPPVLRVGRGDTLRLRFASLDVVHGFYLEGHDLDVTITPLRRSVEVRRGLGPAQTIEEVVLVAERSGKFRYRCSRTCGAMHPFMVGELIVAPNRLFPGAAGAALGLLGGALLLPWARRDQEEQR